MPDRKEYLKKYCQEYWIRNKDKLKKQHKQWAKNNPEKILKIAKHYRENNYEKINKRKKLWCINNPGKRKKYNKKWNKNNPEYNKQYQIENRERLLEYAKQWIKKKLKIDLKFNLNSKIRTAIWQSLKGNKPGRHWEDLVGYTLNDLIKRLQKTMPKGYCWQDFLQGKLHIDHKIPISAFNFNKPEHTDFKRCWALSNLQLLPAKENMTKHNKLSRPFQPALKI